MTVIDDLTRSLTTFLSERTGHADVRNEHPTAAWADDASPFLALVLRRIAEVADRRDADWSDVRDDNGRVVGRLAPSRWFRCTYHVVAVAPDPIVEHRLLGAVLAATVGVDALPEQHLTGVLEGEADPLTMHVAHRGVNTVDWWEGAGLPPRAALELTVVAPVRPVLDTEVGPPAEMLSLGARRIAGGGAAAVAQGVIGERRWTRFTVEEGTRSDDA